MSVLMPPGLRAENAVPGVYNAKRANLTKWRAARGKVLSGDGDAKVAYIGDSTTAGIGAGTGGIDYQGARARSSPAYLAKRLASLGIPTTYQNVWGNSFRSETEYPLYHPKVALGSGWVPSAAGVNTFGARSWTNTTTTTALSFTPDIPVDTFVLWYSRNTALGTIAWDVDGGAATQIVEAGAMAFLPAVITVPLGTHTLNVARVSGSAFVCGIEAYNSAAPSVRVQNMGWPNSQSIEWSDATQSWKPTAALPIYAPDLTIINLGINDGRLSPANLTNGTFASNMQAIITAAKTSGDVLLYVPHPVDTGQVSQPLQDATNATLRSLAYSNGCLLVDGQVLFTSYATANAIGLFNDTLHLKAPGYAAVGTVIADVLARA